VVIGCSAGGISAAEQIVSKLPMDFAAPIVFVQHMNASMNMFFIDYLNARTQLKLKQAKHMEILKAGFVYYVPPNYHALLEEERINLNSDAKVNYSRPSIDVFFESVALEEREKVVGVVLTGANDDGAYGLDLIKQGGGTTIVQNPETAEHDAMPMAAIKRKQPDFILDLEDIAFQLIRLVQKP